MPGQIDVLVIPGIVLSLENLSRARVVDVLEYRLMFRTQEFFRKIANNISNHCKKKLRIN